MAINLHSFKKRDKITYSKFYGTGHTFGLSERIINDLKRRFKILTVSQAETILNIDYEEVHIVYIKEEMCYWPAYWFRKVDTQLEFNFNEK